MDFDISVVQSVSIIIIMILMGMGFRNIGILKEEDSTVFARLITNYTLPALIFHALSTTEFDRTAVLDALSDAVQSLADGAISTQAFSDLSLAAIELIPPTLYFNYTEDDGDIPQLITYICFSVFIKS